MNAKEVKEFLEKETPNEGGCMLCLVTYNFTNYSILEQKEVTKEHKEYMLIEKRNVSNGVMLTINGRFHFDYDFIWENDNPNTWEILYKREV